MFLVIRPKTLLAHQAQLRLGSVVGTKLGVADFLASGVTAIDFTWELDVPRASHINGVVESLVKTCPKGLQSALNYRK